MPLEKVEFKSENELGQIPAYISIGDKQAGVIVLQEVS